MPAERAEPAPERRLLTVLFADLSGYTALCARLDPEDVHDVVRPAMRALRSVAESFGATVPGVQGDGFMAVFGAPVAHEDDAERAVRAAFALRDALREINAGGGPIALPGLHVGVNTGEVVVWAGGGLDELSLAGDAVNIASRLCGIAAAGEICVGERTVELTRRSIDYSDPSPSDVRGISQPVPTYRAARIRPDAVAGRRSVSLRAGFVGRTRLLRQLDGILEAARSTCTMQTALVVGDAGYGKSRLAMQWTGSYDDVTVVSAGCSEYDDDPLAPWASIVPELADLPPGTSDHDRISAAVTLISHSLEALAADLPVIVVLDDIHLASRDSVRVLAELSARRPSVPVVVLALARPGVTALDVHTFRLAPLDDGEMRDLLAGMVGRPLPEDATTVLLERSGGSPLFLEECVVHLVESGRVVVRQDSATVAVGGVDEIPNSMRQFIAARLDALPLGERALVQDAAVAGDAVWDHWLQDLDPDRDVAGLLSSLEERGLLRRRATSAVPVAQEYTFKHALIREVAYESLSRRTRSSRHSSLAHWLEEVSTEGLLPVALLAYHHACAWDLSRSEGDAAASPSCGLATEAVAALTRHAEALGRSNPRRAEAILTRALSVVGLAPACFAATVPAQLMVMRAERRVDIFELADALDDLDFAGTVGTALPLATRGRALLARAAALTFLGRVSEASAFVDEAVDLLRESRDLLGAAEALRLQALNHRFTDRREYLNGLHDAYTAYASAGDVDGQRDVAADLAYELTMEGGPAYRKWLSTAEVTADLTVDVRTRASLRRTEAFMAQNRGERRRADELATLAFADAESIGAVRIVVDAVICRLEATSGLGLIDQNEKLLADALELSERLSLRRFRAQAHIFSARSALLDRRHAVAYGRIAAARALLAEIGATQGRDADLVEVTLGRDCGRWDRATAIGQVAVDGLEQEGSGLYAVPVRLDIARSELGSDPSRAAALLPEVLDAARRHDTPQYGALAAACLEQAQLLSGLETSQRIGAAPERSVELDATVMENAGLRQAARGDWDDAVTSFASAAETWAEIGATVWLARALVWQTEAASRAGKPSTAETEEAVTRLLADLHSPPGLVELFTAQLATVGRG